MCARPCVSRKAWRGKAGTRCLAPTAPGSCPAPARARLCSAVSRPPTRMTRMSPTAPTSARSHTTSSGGGPAGSCSARAALPVGFLRSETSTRACPGRRHVQAEPHARVLGSPGARIQRSVRVRASTHRVGSADSVVWVCRASHARPVGQDDANQNANRKLRATRGTGSRNVAQVCVMPSFYEPAS